MNKNLKICLICSSLFFVFLIVFSFSFQIKAILNVEILIIDYNQIIVLKKENFKKIEINEKTEIILNEKIIPVKITQYQSDKNNFYLYLNKFIYLNNNSLENNTIKISFGTKPLIFHLFSYII